MRELNKLYKELRSAVRQQQKKQMIIEEIQARKIQLEAMTLSRKRQGEDTKRQIKQIRKSLASLEKQKGSLGNIYDRIRTLKTKIAQICFRDKLVSQDDEQSALQFNLRELEKMQQLPPTMPAGIVSAFDRLPEPQTQYETKYPQLNEAQQHKHASTKYCFQSKTIQDKAFAE